MYYNSVTIDLYSNCWKYPNRSKHLSAISINTKAFVFLIIPLNSHI